MLQLSKRVEYGLIALRHMASGGDTQIFTTKEVAEKYHISYQLLAKIMQRLAKEKLISSYQGVHGGYTLLRRPESVTVGSIINAIEGKSNVPIVQCEAETAESCVIHDTCTIKDPLVKLQHNINKMFDQITVSELL